jgi:hypothetical protein
MFAHNLIDAETPVAVFFFREVPQVIEDWNFQHHPCGSCEPFQPRRHRFSPSEVTAIRRSTARRVMAMIVVNGSHGRENQFAKHGPILL